MLPSQIHCLEDFKKVPQTKEIRQDVLEHLSKEVTSLFGRDMIGDVSVLSQLEGISFFEALFLIVGSDILHISFLSNKVRKKIEKLHAEYILLGKVIDANVVPNQMINLAKIVQDVDELFIKQQLKIDSKYFKEYFNKADSLGCKK